MAFRQLQFDRIWKTKKRFPDYARGGCGGLPCALPDLRRLPNRDPTAPDSEVGRLAGNVYYPRWPRFFAILAGPSQSIASGWNNESQSFVGSSMLEIPPLSTPEGR